MKDQRKAQRALVRRRKRQRARERRRAWVAALSYLPRCRECGMVIEHPDHLRVLQDWFWLPTPICLACHMAMPMRWIGMSYPWLTDDVVNYSSVTLTVVVCLLVLVVVLGLSIVGVVPRVAVFFGAAWALWSGGGRLYSYLRYERPLARWERQQRSTAQE